MVALVNYIKYDCNIYYYYLLVMGCCQSNFELEEMAVVAIDNVNINDPRIIKTEEGFGDLSLDSHRESTYEQRFETSKTHLGDSMTCETRTKSISLHRPDIEHAFLQSCGLIRKKSIQPSTGNNH
jgi:hypothetical protein